MYSLYSGYRRPLWRRVASKTFTGLAIAGWVLIAFLLISIIFGFFDELLILSWEATE